MFNTMSIEKFCRANKFHKKIRKDIILLLSGGVQSYQFGKKDFELGVGG